MNYLNLAVNAFKVFKGSKASAKATEQLYKKASAVVDSIPEAKLQETVGKLFKSQGSKNTYFEDLENIQKAVSEYNAPQEVRQAVENIKAKANSYVAECEEGALSGKVRENYTYESQIRNDLYTIEDYANEIGNNGILQNNLEKMEYSTKILQDLLKVRQNSPFDARIGKLKDGILPKDGILYHGTKQPRAILKTGFSELRSNQVHKSSREFGAGVYLTPDKKIASHFAGIRGRILGVKADVKNTAMVNDKQFSGLTREAASLLSQTGYEAGTKEGNAILELIMKKLFNKAGYDSVYTSNSMASGIFAKSADEWLGRAQSQLVVFDGAKVTSAGKKTFTQKIKDELLQIGTRFKVIYNLQKMAIKNPDEFWLSM